MLGRLMRGIFLLPLSIAVIVLVIIGLIDFDMLVAIAPKVIAAIVIIGVFALLAKIVFLPR